MWGMIGLLLPRSQAELLQMLGLRVNYRQLPAPGSNERTTLIRTLATAFGPPGSGGWANPAGALDRAVIYDQLSQLSYDDRITILRDVYRHQGFNGIEGLRNAEAGVRLMFLHRMSHGADNNPTFAGVNQFLHLMSDAPQDRRHEGMLNTEIQTVFRMGENNFTDRNTPGIRQNFQTFMGPYVPPYQRVRSIGIVLGNPPLRTTNPLGFVPVQTYQTLPALDSQEGRRLVAQVVATAGRPADANEAFLVDPDGFFRLMANYSYADRITLYRAVLRAQGLNFVAGLPERNIRMYLMKSCLHNPSGDMSFAGVDSYFRLVADAPNNAANRENLTSEIIELMAATNWRQYVDRDNPAIRANYQRFFEVGGANRNLLVADPYSRLALIGIPIGRPPVLNPAIGARPVFRPPPVLWDRLDINPDASPLRGLSLQPPAMACSVNPVTPDRSVSYLNAHSPLAHV